jgi:RNA polymerase sigma-70 factor (ECF subfamily)
MDSIPFPDPPPVSVSPRAQMIALLPDMRGFARFLVRDRTEADDLVQEAVVRALAAFEQFQPGTNLKSWLFTILRNAFFEQARRRRTERAALERAAMPDEPPASDPESRAALSDLQRRLWSLPPLLREALVLVGAQELSYDEAAVICGVPVGTMKARVSRARTQLRHMVEGASAPPEGT